MSFLKKLLIGGAATKTYQNVYNKPIITAPPGYVVRGMKQKGLGSKWVIEYSKESSMNIKASFTVNKNITAMNVGGNKFIVDWP